MLTFAWQEERRYAINEQDIAHLRSYLASQSLRRTPQELAAVLQAAYEAFLKEWAAIPDDTSALRPAEREWSAAHITAHVLTVMRAYEEAVCLVLEQGRRPEAQSAAISGSLDPLLLTISQEAIRHCLDRTMHHLRQAILQANPEAHLALTWDHFELGAMPWREWVLFARVHLLEHVRQMQALAAQPLQP